MRWSPLVVAAAAATLGQSAAAQTVTSSAGTSFTTTALTTSNTSDFNMVGMKLTGFDASGGVFSTTFGDIFGNGNVYGTVNSMFTLFLRSHESTAIATWRLRSGVNSSLTRLIINGAPGLTVFDRTFNFTSGTPGSNGGIDFGFLLGDVHATTVTYRNQVGVGNNAPVGDIFETLDIAFGTPLNPNEAVDFMADTDNAALNSPIVPVVATPEPASLGLLATGLLAIGVVRRRRRRS